MTSWVTVRPAASVAETRRLACPPASLRTWTLQEVSPHLVPAGRQVWPPSHETSMLRLTTGSSATVSGIENRTVKSYLPAGAVLVDDSGIT